MPAIAAVASPLRQQVERCPVDLRRMQGPYRWQASSHRRQCSLPAFQGWRLCKVAPDRTRTALSGSWNQPPPSAPTGFCFHMEIAISCTTVASLRVLRRDYGCGSGLARDGGGSVAASSTGRALSCRFEEDAGALSLASQLPQATMQPASLSSAGEDAALTRRQSGAIGRHRSRWGRGIRYLGLARYAHCCGHGAIGIAVTAFCGLPSTTRSL